MPDGRAWPAATNVGPNPTFGEQGRKIEAHLIGFTGDLYGREARVRFTHRLRGQERFDAVDDLIAQMRLDVERVRALASEE